MVVLGAAVFGAARGATPVGAQESDTNRIVPGDSVRVRMDDGFVVGASFQRWAGESMVLGIDGLDGEWNVSVFDMRTLEVYTDRTRREGFRHGALLGAAAGLFIGAVAGISLNAAGVTDDPDAPSDQLITQAISGAVIGMAGGALVYGIHRGRNPGRGWIGVVLPTR